MKCEMRKINREELLKVKLFLESIKSLIHATENQNMIDSAKKTYKIVYDVLDDEIQTMKNDSVLAMICNRHY